MSALCQHCGHELPNAAGTGLYCVECGEPVRWKVVSPRATKVVLTTNEVEIIRWALEDRASLLHEHRPGRWIRGRFTDEDGINRTEALLDTFKTRLELLRNLEPADA